MRRTRVSDILLPCDEAVPSEPSLSLSDKIVYAVEFMVTRNLESVAVVHHQTVVGVVKLEDALAKLGLDRGKGNRFTPSP